MTKIVVHALKMSIKKWEKISSGKGTDQGWVDCPLCMLFNPEGWVVLQK
jgi:hypothetical protein